MLTLHLLCELLVRVLANLHVSVALGQQAGDDRLGIAGDSSVVLLFVFVRGGLV